jgi:hypothetical protein
VDYLWALISIPVLVGMVWLGFMIEPHWVNKDGLRFLCNAQLLDMHGNVISRWRETRISVSPSGDLLADQRKLMRHNVTVWHMSAESPHPPRNKAIFLLSGRDRDDRPAMMAIRLPAKSRAIEALRPLVGTH